MNYIYLLWFKRFIFSMIGKIYVNNENKANSFHAFLLQNIQSIKGPRSNQGRGLLSKGVVWKEGEEIRADHEDM